MGWSNPFLFELTIPAGAGTGARIEINKNNNGRIDIYNAANQLVDSLGGPLGKLIIGMIGGADGHFEFDPNVGLFAGYDSAGIERFELISSDGSFRVIDAASTQVLFIGGPTGIIAQTAADGSKILQIEDQDIFFIRSPDEAEPLRYGSITYPAGGLLTLISGGTDTAPARSQIEMHSGSTSQSTGSLTAPNLQISHTGGNSDVDILLSGNMIATTVAGVRETWNAPTFNAGWATDTPVGAYPPLMWRRDCEDNFHIQGTFQVTDDALAGTVVATGFPNSIGSDVAVGGPIAKIGGPGTSVLNSGCYVNNAGGLTLNNIANIATGDYFMLNTIIPIRQLT